MSIPSSPAALTAPGIPNNTMSDVIDSLKRLERVGSENSKTTEKLIAAAAELSDKIVKQYALQDEESCEVVRTVRIIKARVQDDEVPETRSVFYSIAQAKLINDLTRQYVALNRDAALAFSKDVATGLLDDIVDALEMRSQVSAEALEILTAGNSTIGEPASSIELFSFAKEHLFYEAQMFLGAREALRFAQPQSFERNARIEVCALHFRNLVNFFYLPRPRVDDVVAVHYVPDWVRQRPAISAPLEKARSRANKELAHLTTRRIAGSAPEKAWDFHALSAEMRPVIRAFVQLVTPERVPQNTIAELSKI